MLWSILLTCLLTLWICFSRVASVRREIDKQFCVVMVFWNIIQLISHLCCMLCVSILDPFQTSYYVNGTRLCRWNWTLSSNLTLLTVLIFKNPFHWTVVYDLTNLKSWRKSRLSLMRISRHLIYRLYSCFQVIIVGCFFF